MPNNLPIKISGNSALRILTATRKNLFTRKLAILNTNTRLSGIHFKPNQTYYYTQVVNELFTVHNSHLTVQHHTNLHLHFTCLLCSIGLCRRLQELQRDLHFPVDPMSLWHVLPSIPGEPAVAFRTQ